jgi:MFS transporter, ACS family, hexuronate transporter
MWAVSVSFLQNRRRWLIVGMLFFVSTVSYLDRQTLSVLAVTLREKLGFTSVEYSYAVTAFLAAYAIGFSFSGRVIDRFGVRVCIVSALVFWSLAGMLHAAAAGWIGLAVYRFLLGLGESFSTPTASKVLTAWVPQRERGLSTGVFSTGHFVGAMIAPPLVTWLTLRHGWQSSFIITGATGLLLAAAWWRFYRPPETHPMLSEQERAMILQERGTSAVAVSGSMWGMLKHPACLGFFCTRFLTDSISHFYAFWLPEYLQSARGLSLASLGLVAWLPFLAADVGTLGGGAFSDWFVRRGFTPRRARRTVMLIAACLMPLSLAAVRVDSLWICVATIGLLMAAQSCWNTNLFTLTSETVPRAHVASVVALAAMGGSIGGMVSTLLTGQTIKAFGYAPVFTAFGFVHLTAFVLLGYALRRADRLAPRTPVS